MQAGECSCGWDPKGGEGGSFLVQNPQGRSCQYCSREASTVSMFTLTVAKSKGCLFFCNKKSILFPRDEREAGDAFAAACS